MSNMLRLRFIFLFLVPFNLWCQDQATFYYTETKFYVRQKKQIKRNFQFVFKHGYYEIKRYNGKEIEIFNHLIKYEKRGKEIYLISQDSTSKNLEKKQYSISPLDTNLINDIYDENSTLCYAVYVSDTTIKLKGGNIECFKFRLSSHKGTKPQSYRGGFVGNLFVDKRNYFPVFMALYSFSMGKMEENPFRIISLNHVK